MVRTIALTATLLLALTGTAQARCHSHHCYWAHAHPWQFRYTQIPEGGPFGKAKLYRVRMCESSDRPTAHDPSGTYHGLYQLTLDTGRRAGFRGDPHLASRLEQTVRVWRYVRRHGWGEWPACGLR